MSGRTAQIRLDDRLHLRLWQLMFLRSLPRCFGVSAVTISAIVVVLAMIEGLGIDLLYPALGGAVGLACVLVFQWLTLSRRSGRIFRETAQLGEEKQFLANQEGFEFTWSSGHSRTLWSDLVKWDENSDLIALFPNRLMAYPLPKAQMDPEMQEFIREHLRGAGMPIPGRLRK